jgi:hypothetical protein
MSLQATVAFADAARPVGRIDQLLQGHDITRAATTTPGAPASGLQELAALFADEHADPHHDADRDLVGSPAATPRTRA